MAEKKKSLWNDVQNICQVMHAVSKMDVHFINQEGSKIFGLASHGEPAFIQNSTQDYQLIHETLIKHNSLSFHYYINAFGLEYISTAIRDNDNHFGTIIIGPFLSTTPGTDFMNTIVSKNHLPISSRKQLQEFYASLSVVNSTFPNMIGTLLVNISSHTFIHAQLITSESIQLSQNKRQMKEILIESKHIIESRYKHEKRLMNAIATGNTEEVKRFMDSINYFDDRIPESPIRSTKNVMIILNTLCRVSAEKGGVHPVYIHETSDKFARLINRATNLAYLNDLQNIMVMEYCQLVKEYSTINYSTIVKKAINHINLHLEENLTLESIASTIPVHPSHLSRTFKKETNMNITTYIQKQRIEMAKIYLQSESISITDIAFMVGFNDLNYFSRLFKKSTGMTPSQYAKKSAKG